MQYLQRICFNIYKKYIVKFKTNDCFKNITHELVVFAHYFNRYT